jgi:hypothetical protein
MERIIAPAHNSVCDHFWKKNVENAVQHMFSDFNAGDERRSLVGQRSSKRHYLLRRKSSLLCVSEKHIAQQG